MHTRGYTTAKVVETVLEVTVVLVEIVVVVVRDVVVVDVVFRHERPVGSGEPVPFTGILGRVQGKELQSE